MIKKPKTKIIYLSIFILILALCGAVFYIHKSLISKHLITLKCPELYATNDEYLTTLKAWIRQESASNPNMTVEELTTQRYQFLVDNNCVKTLQHLKENVPIGSGTAPSDIIKNEVNNYNNK